RLGQRASDRRGYGGRADPRLPGPELLYAQRRRPEDQHRQPERCTRGWRPLAGEREGRPPATGRGVRLPPDHPRERTTVGSLAAVAEPGGVPAARRVGSQSPGWVVIELACHVLIPIVDSADTVAGLACF